MMKYTLLIYVIWLSVYAQASPVYEVRMSAYPSFPHSAIEMHVIHPFNLSNSPYHTLPHGYINCTPVFPRPDWGARGTTADDPTLIDSPYAPYVRFIAQELNDPGDYLVRLVSTYGDATTIVQVVRWPGVEPRSYTNIVRHGETHAILTLPGAQDMGLQVQRARQIIRWASPGYHRVRMNATFDTIAPFDENTIYFRSSIGRHHWVSTAQKENIRVRRNGRVARFGRPRIAVARTARRHSLRIRGVCDERMQDQFLPVFIAIGGWSGFDMVPFNHRARYRAPRHTP